MRYEQELGIFGRQRGGKFLVKYTFVRGVLIDDVDHVRALDDEIGVENLSHDRPVEESEFIVQTIR